LLRDIERGNDPQVAAVAGVIARVDPDVLVLQGIDFDHDLLALRALQGVIAQQGSDLPFAFARRPNRGRPIGTDLDGDGRLGEPEDAHSYGWFSGEAGQAILSRFDFVQHDVRDFDALLWAEMPAPLWPEDPMPGQEVQRLSSAGHWVVPIQLERTQLTLMTFHATTPVFDGPEDRNGRRNHDEIRFWRHFLDGSFGPPPEAPWLIMGNANLDPVDGEGRKSAILDLIQDPRLQDPVPRRSGRAANSPGHAGDPLADTVAWPEPVPGHLRVSYILPSAEVRVLRSGVYWPDPGPEAEMVDRASRHRIVWVDIEITP
jgi:hypothetical protein